ncbi:organoarsenical effux MFS transporter ArsJ [Roseococcus suduntuyensis]|uniref:Putative MFS family arabinose efflux permease n=1 Tax=Roseococcus suduntuyensis TaxID=455361 RepID=A0A840AEK1_9PROT|nr:organoarsenical effux MFS transporter ArsJ [Roseococcus suduntuyensis]MBB3899322.1 putative MFS family arabinose efflux permease [Roseococcus suduntuyensis]
MRNYATVTAAYWGFTLTDGALRMLVLLHFFQLGYSPFTLAFLFLLYEAAGIGANLIGGWLATRFGIARMLAVGLSAQVSGFLLLSAVSPSWGAALSVAWVVVAQGVCGVAKDLTKTASKSAIKITHDEALRTAADSRLQASPSSDRTPAGGESQLFRWVAFFTGSKNAMKGLGFFLGGLLLEALGFRGALWAMAAALLLVLAFVLLSLPPMMGKARASKSAKELFAKNAGVNLLAAARVFLFGARDVWFVVGLPVFLYASGWTFTMVGGFLAVWTIGYGIIQAAAPAVVRRSADGLSTEVPAARSWSLALALVPAILAAMMLGGVPRADLFVPIGLCVFGALFAVNSSVHSYLVLAYAGSEKAAEDVGFYYAANAAGRFMGTLLSGLLYMAGGLVACLLGAAAMLAICWLVTLALPTRQPHHARPGAA